MGSICGIICLSRGKRKNTTTNGIENNSSQGGRRENLQIILSPTTTNTNTPLQTPLLSEYENQPVPVGFLYQQQQEKKQKLIGVEKKLKKVTKPSRSYRRQQTSDNPFIHQNSSLSSTSLQLPLPTGQQLKKQNGVILLGCNESGKSTLLQQINILTSPLPALILNPGEQAEVKRLLVCTMVNDMKRTISWMNSNNIKPATSIPSFYCDYLLNYQSDFIRSHVPFIGNRIPFEIKNTLQSLWADPVVRESYIKCNRLHSATWRYFEQFDRIASDTWIPTIEDTLLCRHYSSNVEHVRYRDVDFYDIGGSKSSPDCWATSLSQAGFVVFLVSCISSQLGFKQSVGLFRAACSSEWLRDVPFVVLFTKADLFEGKYCEQLLLDYYGQRGSSSNSDSSISSVMRALEDVFVQAERGCPMSNRTVYTYWISLISTRQVRTAIDQITSKLRDRK